LPQQKDSKTVIFHPIKSNQIKSFPASVIASPSGTIDYGRGRISLPRTVMFGNDLCDFLPRANLDNGDPETLLFSRTRFFKFLAEKQGSLSWRPE
jgi:hypothetical protein